MLSFTKGYSTSINACDYTCGDHQGSILGHLLFLIYVKDMSGVVGNTLLLYADDSAILIRIYLLLIVHIKQIVVTVE